MSIPFNQPPGPVISDKNGTLVPVWQSWFNQLWTYVTQAASFGGLGGNPTAKVGLTAINGTSAAYMRADAAPALNTSVLGGNPTAKVGLAAVNGSATTSIRSDGAPALDQSIAPTWTALHAFAAGIKLPITTVAALPASPAGTVYAVSDASGPTYNATVAGGGAVTIPVFYDGTNWKCH